jgi:DNA-binding NarL/FixJ family response regulator
MKKIETVMANPITHILLIEESPKDVRFIQSLLAATPSDHFTCEHVDQLSQAIEIMRNEPFELVLLDLSLPDSQGLNTFNILYSYVTRLPIVILVDFKDEVFAEQAIQAGAQDFLIKGQVNRNRLIDTLHHAIERKQIENTLQVRVRELMVTAQQFEAAIKSSHELNHALIQVLLSIEELVTKIPPKDLKDSEIQMVNEAVGRVGQLEADLMQFSVQSLRTDSGMEIPGSIPGVLGHLRENRNAPTRKDATDSPRSADSESDG